MLRTKTGIKRTKKRETKKTVPEAKIRGGKSSESVCKLIDFCDDFKQCFFILSIMVIRLLKTSSLFVSVFSLGTSCQLSLNLTINEFDFACCLCVQAYVFLILCLATFLKFTSL